MAENRAWGFFQSPQPAPGQIALSSPEGIEENYHAWQYDAPGYAVAPKSVTKQVKTRPTPGRDGATSEHIIEKVDGKTNSVTHRVKKDGQVLHQHQTHVGKYGSERRFPDEWIEYPTIPKE